MKSEMFCCQGLANLIANAGRRGLSVLVVKTSTGLNMMFQCRSIDVTDESKLVPIPFDINLTCEIGLQFCPFCAAPIREAITKNLQAFAELADVHQMLQSIHPKKT